MSIRDEWERDQPPRQISKVQPFTPDDPKCADVLARLALARKEMLKRGVKPLVRASKKEPQRPTWQRVEIMSSPEQPTTVTSIRRRKV